MLIGLFARFSIRTAQLVQTGCGQLAVKQKKSSQLKTFPGSPASILKTKQKKFPKSSMRLIHSATCTHMRMRECSRNTPPAALHPPEKHFHSFCWTVCQHPRPPLIQVEALTHSLYPSDFGAPSPQYSGGIYMCEVGSWPTCGGTTEFLFSN
jgi:hypothetical protein